MSRALAWICWVSSVAAVLAGCAERMQGPTRPRAIANRIVGTEVRLDHTCRELANTASREPADPRALSKAAIASREGEVARDACRLAAAVDPATMASGCTLQQAEEVIDGRLRSPGEARWLELLLQSTGAIDDGAFDAETFAASFDLSRVVMRNVIELGDLADVAASRISASFGRFSGVAKTAFDLVIAEAVVASLDRALDEPVLRHFAEPSEVARTACKHLEDGASRPFVTRRMLKRSILRLRPDAAALSLDHLCAGQQRPGVCDPLLAKAARNGKRNGRRDNRNRTGGKDDPPQNDPVTLDGLCGQTRVPHVRSACKYAWFLVSARNAKPLDELCDGSNAPACRSLAKAAGSGTGSLRAWCEDATTPARQGQCKRAVQYFAERGAWHRSQAENACWSNPRACARAKRLATTRGDAMRPSLPDGILAPKVTPGEDELGPDAAQLQRASTGLSMCLRSAEELCGDRCVVVDEKRHCDADFATCVADACSIVATTAMGSEDDLGNVPTKDDGRALPPALVRALEINLRLANRSRQDVDLQPMLDALDDAQRALPDDVWARLKDDVLKLIDPAEKDHLRSVLDQLDERMEQEARQKELQARLAREREELVSWLATRLESHGVGVRATSDGISLEIGEVAFKRNKHTLRHPPTSVCPIAEALQTAQQEGKLTQDSFRVQVVGFSSPVAFVGGDPSATNMRLSLLRAHEVYDYLTKNTDKANERTASGRTTRDSRVCEKTIGQHLFEVVGRGYNDTTIGTAEELRRVEVRILYGPTLTPPAAREPDEPSEP